MKIDSATTKGVSYIISLIAAVVILIDFSLPGQVYLEEIIAMDKIKQNYYNAGGNYHYYYKVSTPRHKLVVGSEFAKSTQLQKIKYTVSPIFGEVNIYQDAFSQDQHIHSLRIATGFVFPLLVISIIVIVMVYPVKINMMVVILQIILLANCIYLMS